MIFAYDRHILEYINVLTNKCTYTSAGIFDLTSSRGGKLRGLRKICCVFIYNIPGQLFK